MVVWEGGVRWWGMRERMVRGTEMVVGGTEVEAMMGMDVGEIWEKVTRGRVVVGERESRFGVLSAVSAAC
jgi:hypothetical protein